METDRTHSSGPAATGHGGHGHSASGHGGHSHGSAHGEHDHGGMGKYWAVFIALLILTSISFGVGMSPIMSTPSLGWTVMLAVSCAKALLVMLFFMHLLWEANWKYVLTIPASIMSVFLLIMLTPDVGLRTHHYTEQRWLYAAEPHFEDEEEAEDEPEAPVTGVSNQAVPASQGKAKSAGRE